MFANMKKTPLYPDWDFIKEVETYGSFNTEACFQCKKCTNGCPVTFAMDIYPDEIVRRTMLGQRESILKSKTIWVCSACETCTTRCPNSVKIAELMDCLKEMALKENIPCPQPQILSLHEIFLDSVKKHGRVAETAFLTTYLIRSGQVIQKFKDGTWVQEAKLGWELFSKGRSPLFSHKIKEREAVRRILTRLKEGKEKP
jgi:heterodisulfide reductase subunit C